MRVGASWREEAVIRNSRITATDRKTDSNLSAVIAVGYKVNSARMAEPLTGDYEPPIRLIPNDRFR
jgi:hypothetical protein